MLHVLTHVGPGAVSSLTDSSTVEFTRSFATLKQNLELQKHNEHKYLTGPVMMHSHSNWFKIETKNQSEPST